MHAATVGFDVDRYARDQFLSISNSSGFAELKTKGFRVLVSVSSKKVIDFCGAAIGSLLVSLLQREIRRIKQSTLIFRSLRDELKAAIEETNKPVSDELLQLIDKTQSALVKLRSSVKNVCFLLREANEGSRVASAFEAFAHEVNDLMTAVYRFRLVAIGADIAVRSWDEAISASRHDVLSASNSIDDMSESGIDSEIYVLSMAAIHQAELRDN